MTNIIHNVLLKHHHRAIFDITVSNIFENRKKVVKKEIKGEIAKYMISVGDMYQKSKLCDFCVAELAITGFWW